jgi:putative membrane protein
VGRPACPLFVSRPVVAALGLLLEARGLLKGRIHDRFSGDIVGDCVELADFVAAPSWAGGGGCGNGVGGGIDFGAAQRNAASVIGLRFFPLTLLTFGLFAIVLNGLILYATAAIVAGFRVSNFLIAIIAAVLLGILNSLIFWALPV